MAPHGIYRAAGDDQWIAIACRSDADWVEMAKEIDADWANVPTLGFLAGRLAAQDDLDARIDAWTRQFGKHDIERRLQAAGIAAAAVLDARERIDEDQSNEAFGLWPTVRHSAIGEVRVDGLPVRFSRTPHVFERGAPCLGEHNEQVLANLLGMSADEIATLRKDRII